MQQPLPWYEALKFVLIRGFKRATPWVNWNETAIVSTQPQSYLSSSFLKKKTTKEIDKQFELLHKLGQPLRTGILELLPNEIILLILSNLDFLEIIKVHFSFPLLKY